MQLRSDAYAPNETNPRAYVRDGEDKSPPLSWSGVPGDTKSLALIVEDPDAPSGTFTHWVIFDIPVTHPGLSEDVSHAGDFTDGTRQGDNDFDERGYSGPRPTTRAAATCPRRHGRTRAGWSRWARTRHSSAA